MGKGGGGGPSLAEMEDSQRRIMNEQMTLSTNAQIASEDRLRIQREEDRIAEKQRLNEAKVEEADKLVQKNKQETAAAAEIFGGSPKDDNPNLDSPTIEEPDYGSEEVRPK